METATRTERGTARVAQELKRPYVLVLVLLAVVTLGEIQVPGLGVSLRIATSVQILLLMTSSAAKASLVALYYMHLRYERRILGLVPVGPLVFALLLIFVVISR